MKNIDQPIVIKLDFNINVLSLNALLLVLHLNKYIK